MDSFETRYIYFLGKSPNFFLFRILKFGVFDFVMNFHQIFIEIATFSMKVCTSVVSDFLEVYGSIGLKFECQ